MHGLHRKTDVVTFLSQLVTVHTNTMQCMCSVMEGKSRQIYMYMYMETCMFSHSCLKYMKYARFPVISPFSLLLILPPLHYMYNGKGSISQSMVPPHPSATMLHSVIVSYLFCAICNLISNGTAAVVIYICAVATS